MVIGYLTRLKTAHLSLHSLKPIPSHLEAIAALDVAPFSNQMAMIVAQIVVNNVLHHYGAQSHYGSETPLACVGVITKVNIIFFSLVTGLPQGLQPIVSFNCGTKKCGRVRGAYLKAVYITTAISVFAFLHFQLISRQIIGIFGSGSKGYSHFAEERFRIFLSFTFINGLQPITANFSTSIGKTAKSILIPPTRQIIFLPPLIVTLPIISGIESIMFSASAADLMVAISAVTFMVRGLGCMEHLPE